MTQPSGGDFPPNLPAFSASMNSVPGAAVGLAVMTTASSTDVNMGLTTSSPRTAAFTGLVSSSEVSSSAVTSCVAIIVGLVSSNMSGSFCSSAETSSFTKLAFASGGWTTPPPPRRPRLPKQGTGTSGAGEPSTRGGLL